MTKMQTIQLSEHKPYQSPGPANRMAYQQGDELHTWQGEDGWYWCISGIGPNGNYGETDDIGPFDSRPDAIDDAKNYYDQY